MDLVNPYIVGNPISQESGFLGREAVVREVMSMLAHPHANAIVLHGQRRIGKTSILLQLHRILKSEGYFTPIYLDLQDKASLPLEELLYRLAQEIAEAMDIEPPDRHLFDSEGVYFRDTFLFSISVSSRLVLLFDEFDVLDSSGRSAGQSFFPYLRRWMSSLQSVNFVFVLGRRPEDLSTETLSTFKGAIASRVTSLAKLEADSLVRQSEAKSGLKWQSSAVERVWELAQGHPYFTQLLASVVWDAWRNKGALRAPVAPEQVDAGIPQALRQGTHSFLWIWNGLPPAERIVLAALTERPGKVSQDDLVEILGNAGVWMTVRELIVAPDNLVDWGVLKASSDSFEFSVPLFREWLVSTVPLRRVKDELDHLNPLAENLFAAARQLYQLDLPSEAKAKLVESLRFNPNHLRSRILLGNILLEEGDLVGAVSTLEDAYQADHTVRPDYVRALLASAERATEDDQLETYRKVLSIDPRQRLAAEGISHIQEKRKKQQILNLQGFAIQAESDGDWGTAVEIYQQIYSLDPAHSGLDIKIAEAKKQLWLLVTYREAVSALTKGAKDTAQERLIEIIKQQPDYEDTARYLLLAVKGIDIRQVEGELHLLASQLRAANEKIVRLEKEVQDHKRMRDKDFLVDFKEFFGSVKPDAWISCVICGTQVKGKNMLRHFVQRHARFG